MENHGAALTRIPLEGLCARTRRVLGAVDDILVHSLKMNVRFRQVNRRDGLLLHGPYGWAEASPFWDYDPKESANWLTAALAHANEEHPTPLRERVPVNATIPVIAPEDAYEKILHSGGCATAKVKVADPGTPLDEDIERVRSVALALKETAGEAARVRVDANGAWDVDTAISAINALEEAARDAGGLEYVEQPCLSVPELAQVRSAVKTPIAADESIRRAPDPLAVARAGGADVAIIKIAPLGGIRQALRIGEESGLTLVISSALESSIGLAAGVHAAACLPGQPPACGLATGGFFTADTVATPLRVEEGNLPLRELEPDLSLLEGPGVAPELSEQWLRRLDAMCAHLDEKRSEEKR